MFMKICLECGRELNIEEMDVCFSCKELERIAGEAISSQNETIKYARELAEELRETRETIGDWNGLEEAAAKAMNRIYDSIVEAVEIATASSRIPIHPDVIEIIFMTAQEQWLEDKELLFLTKETTRQYAMNLFKGFI